MPPRRRDFGFPPPPSDFDASDVTKGLADHEQPPSPLFARAGSLTDLDSLPRRFDLLVGEVRDGFEMLGGKLLPGMERLESAISRLLEREAIRDADALEQSRLSAELRLRVDRIEQHLKLEPIPLPPPPTLPPRAKRNTLKR